MAKLFFLYNSQLDDKHIMSKEYVVCMKRDQDVIYHIIDEKILYIFCGAPLVHDKEGKPGGVLHSISSR
eukprot:6793374-Heterocapsa_arctica.AAC.1